MAEQPALPGQEGEWEAVWGNLAFSLERIAPFFLLIILGGFLRSRGAVSEGFFQGANQFVFKIALPLNLFMSIAQPGVVGEMPVKLLAYAFVATVAAFGLIWLVTELIFRDKDRIGTLVQGAFRGNFVLLGAPIMEAMTGPSGARLAALTVLAVVPAYNVLAVVALTVRGKSPGKLNLGKVLRGIITNPLIIATLLALPFFFWRIPIPYFAAQTIGYVGNCATPLGLLSVGGLFHLKDATACLRPALYATSIKVGLKPLVLTLAAIALGFRGDELLLLFVLFAAPTAIASFPLATAMGGDGPLAANILILTTSLSAFAMAVGTSLLRTLGLV